MELIGKQIAIETILGQPPELHYPSWYAAQIEKLPPAPPEYLAEQAGILVTDTDTISRQAAIDRATKEHDFFRGAVTVSDKARRDELLNVMCWLGELPSAQPEQQWIPCSERLPENRLYVLVTYKYEYGLIDHGITWYGQAEEKWDTSREVIAWMPLPEPWRGDSICK